MKKLLAAAFACIGLAATAQPLTPPPVAARAFILVDALSGRTLAAGAEEERFEPASLTKLMTAYVVLAAMRDGRIEPATAVEVSPAAAREPGARMFLAAGRSVSIGELLAGMVVISANDAAVALAEAVSGSRDAFVAAMNAQARRLGLENTAYLNPTGQPQAGHHTSARDVAVLAQALIRDFPGSTALYAQKEFTYNRMTQANRNRLLWTDSTVDGMKTGFTENAGYCLVASARRGERRLVSVVMGAQTEALRNAESQKLLNFGFQAYDTRRLFRKGDAVATPEVYKGTVSQARIGFDRDVWLTLPRERFEGLAATLQTRQPFVAPLAAGEKAGIMKLMRDETLVAEIPVVALDDVPVAGFLSRGWDTLRLLFRS